MGSLRNDTGIIKGPQQHLDLTTVGWNLAYSKLVCKISFPQITTTTINLLSSKMKARTCLLISFSQITTTTINLLSSKMKVRTCLLISLPQITTTTINLLSSKMKVRTCLLISLIRNFKVLIGKLLKTITEMKSILWKKIYPPFPSQIFST